MRFDVDRLGRLAGLPDREKRSLNEAGNRSHHDDRSGDENDHRWGKNQLSEKQVHVDKPGWGQKKWDSGLDEDDDGESRGDQSADHDDYKHFKDTDPGYHGHDGSSHGDQGEPDDYLGEDEDYTTKKTSKKKKHGAKGKPFWGDKAGDKEGLDEDDDAADFTARGDDVADDGDPETAGLGELDDIGWRGMKLHEEDELLEIDEGMLRREIKRMKLKRLKENKLRMAIRGEIQDIFSELGVAQDNSWVYGDDKPTNSRKGFVNMAFPGIGFKK